MSLESLLLLNNMEDKKQGLSEERLFNNLSQIRDLIAFFRWYPDLFVDFIKGKDSGFNFLFYQLSRRTFPAPQRRSIQQPCRLPYRAQE